ncbi:MAG: DUF1294 domain-containing protein [Planctomycetota bacterium]
MLAAQGIGIWIVVASVVTFGLYARDKRAASRSGRRTAEKTLLLWSAVGGWPGGMLAGATLRHKTVKRSYRLKFAVAVAFHLAIVAGYVYLFIC